MAQFEDLVAIVRELQNREARPGAVSSELRVDTSNILTALQRCEADSENAGVELMDPTAITSVTDRDLNTLIVIDEAHRLAPRDLPREDDAARGVRSALVDAVRTTRKYGLGWLFISQTLSSLHIDIIQQLRIFFFGFGLGLGQEFQSLRQLVGSAGTALDLYQSFRDPHSAIDPLGRQYSFMTIGPVSPLSFSGSPLFLNAFNTKEGFLDANRFTPGKGI